ncbi:uncharacterized protein LOC144136230 [Amblyomma americanum]
MFFSLAGPRRTGLVLLLLVALATGRRHYRSTEDDDEDEEEDQGWGDDRGKRRRLDPKPAQESSGHSGFSYEDQDQSPPKAECEVDSFRRGQSECDRILRMNLPHHHGSHDYVCYSLRKYKMCVASVMIQSSCYERTFISQELHKIRGIIQGYSVDCFNITKETNRRGLKVRRLRFRMAKVKLASECSPAAAWAVELTCTKDFEHDMKVLGQLNEPSRAVKKSCRTILRYYHCLTPVTESTSCQKNPEFIKHLEYFPKAITARYQEVCLKELDISPSLFKEKVNTSMAAVKAQADGCKEEEASREFLACALVFNEVVAHSADKFPQCEAYKNFIQCTEMIAKTLNCGQNSEFHYHAVHVLQVLLHDYQEKCKNRWKRGRSNERQFPSGEGRPSDSDNSGRVGGADGRSSDERPSGNRYASTARPEQPEGSYTRRRFFKHTEQVFRITTENPFYPPLRKLPFEPRVPQAEDYPRSHSESSSELERNRPRSENDDERGGRSNRRARPGRRGGTRHVGAEDGNNGEGGGRTAYRDSQGDSGGHRNRLNNRNTKRDEPDKKDDGYQPDPNDGFLEDSEDVEAIRRRKKKLIERL